MKKSAIRNLDYLMIKNEQTGDISWGCDQEWYTSKWQRMAGCGPTVSTNMILYLSRSQTEPTSEIVPLQKSVCLSHMGEMWKYVTPTIRGVSSTKLFYTGVSKYAKAHKQNLRFDYINISKHPGQRPDFIQLLNFLDDALQNDLPIAFLNLNNGKEEALDSWHWVTLISLEFEEDGSSALAEILDEGMVKKIDLHKWFHTTTLGGGFVCLSA